MLRLLGMGPERARRVAVLRGIGIAVAVALGAVAVWLIVTSTSQKRIEIGILAGLWGLLLGAYAAFGSRQAAVEQPVATMPAFDPETLQRPAGEVDVRPSAEILRKQEIAMRREFQARLEKVLRREVQEGLARELAGLRAEVAALRSELVEKVGGQLRLERIETTRLIGSDLEALHQQVRELKVLQSGDVEDVEAEEIDEPVSVSITKTTVTSAEPAVTAVAEPAAPQPVAPEPVAREPEPEPVAELEPEPAAVPEPELGPVSAFADNDPFAAMPRLSPFTDFEPVSEPTAPDAAPPAGGGGRRYREDDSEDNVLARILQRERTSSQ
jgi:hypothetical protein